jgi:hypothetical protein
MPRRGAELAGVEFGGGTDLGRGHGKWMERDRDERRESGRGHATRVHDVSQASEGEGGVHPTSRGAQSERATWAKGGASEVRPVSWGAQRAKQAGDVGRSIRTDEHPVRSITISNN